jgi:uncharacterized protein (TIGR04255 family)
MSRTSPVLHFPADIELAANPLVEAWLEIRWELEPGKIPGSMVDRGFQFALGTFFHSVKDRFGYRKELPASQAPLEMVPYAVRYQFRASEGGWPILQLGSGVATVNYTSPYTWDDFKGDALYLRSRLLEAYSDTELKTRRVALRYRNAEPFDHSSNDLLDFLSENLNVSIELPAHIPGSVSATAAPASANVILTFNLLEPAGIGTLQLATGLKKESNDEGTDHHEQREVLMWQLEVASEDNDAPGLDNAEEFARWLESAHAVVHEWFFSLIEGPLRRKYDGGEVKQ